MAATPQPASLFESVEDTYILWAQLLPVRCDFQRDDGVITFCNGQEESFAAAAPSSCMVWDDYSPETPDDATPDYFAEQLSLRSEGIRERRIKASAGNMPEFEATVIYNDNPSVALV